MVLGSRPWWEIINFTEAGNYLTLRMCEEDTPVDFSRRDCDGLICAAKKVDKIYSEIASLSPETMGMVRNVLEYLMGRYYLDLCKALSGSETTIRKNVNTYFGVKAQSMQARNGTAVEMFTQIILKLGNPLPFIYVLKRGMSPLRTLVSYTNKNNRYKMICDVVEQLLRKYKNPRAWSL
ncbi:hypothetical protein K440DRAFT_265003 [Wilcoxina mikolae CBS 423.85]|nr:hypothetical protein K440DRAFT_265003 [Wilcoxina mikolae CBS 423.85]